jgi:hypothetical protein
MRISVTGNENSSLGQALFKSRKSTQMRICPFFFTGTMLAGHPIGIFFFLYETSFNELFGLDDDLFLLVDCPPSGLRKEP